MRYLAIVLSILFYTQIAGVLIGEGGRIHPDALSTLACTVKNRIDVGWNPHKVLNHYYAPFVPPTKQEIELVKRILTEDYDCGTVYFAYSNNDVYALGYTKYKPEKVICTATNSLCINFYERWFKKGKK